MQYQWPLMRVKLKTGKRVSSFKTYDMKKMICLLMTALTINFTMAQSGKVPGGGGSPGDCPPGCTLVLTYTFTTFNFHKPRTNCESGFGLCIKGVPGTRCNCGWYRPTTSIEKGEVKTELRIEGDKAYFYIPYALKQLDEYKNENTDSFTLSEENAAIINADGKTVATMKPGEYVTKIEGDNFVVVIDLK